MAERIRDLGEDDLTIKNVLSCIDLPITFHRLGFVIALMIIRENLPVTYLIASVYCFTEGAHEFYRYRLHYKNLLKKEKGE